MADRQLTREDLTLAAYKHFAEGKTWERIADELTCDRRTLFNWRHRDLWQEVSAEVIAEFLAEGVPTAWGCLVRNAQKGDTQAAKIILDRIEGKAPQKREPAGQRDRYAAYREIEAMTDDQRERLRRNLELARAGGRTIPCGPIANGGNGGDADNGRRP